MSGIFSVNDSSRATSQADKPSHLKEMVEKILNEYAVEKNHAFKDNQLGIYVRNDATSIIREAASLSKDQYVITGSVGQGQWAMVPWLGVFNKKITESATKGVYIVYLLNKEGDTLYLTFNQGCTEIRNNNSKNETIRIMRENAEMLRGKLDDHGFAANGAMKLGDGLTELAELYQEGVVFYKGYEKGQVPSETELKKDLLDMVAIYDQYMDEFQERKERVEFDKNIILYGPPGTGKTYNTAIYAVAICDDEPLKDVETRDYDLVMARYNELKAAGRIAFTTFHQSYGYEEFIEGIKPVMNEDQTSGDIKYAIEDGVFKKFCKDTAHENKVFIIDEINRGNISKIFGELITLIEGSKRSGMPEAASATLPYSGKEFSVPSNVYILGTMNTADRSIALMDTALRRRFQFIEMMPKSEVLKDITVDGLNISKMLDAINKRIEFLYDREHTIGHALFMALKNNPSVECLASIFEKSVIPLLQEYFYEDYQKIQLVLGDNGKKDEEADIKFIKDTKVVAKDIFVGNVEDVIDLPEKSYSINSGALSRIESYKRIAPGL